MQRLDVRLVIRRTTGSVSILDRRKTAFQPARILIPTKFLKSCYVNTRISNLHSYIRPIALLLSPAEGLKFFQKSQG